MPTPLTLLLVEDQPADAELLLHELSRSGFEPDAVRVETEADFLRELAVPRDLILSDFQLPGFDGLKALALVRARGLDVPFILVSGMIGEDLAVSAMRLGATDYLLKDRLARLGQAVTHALEQHRLRREHTAMIESLAQAEAKYRGLFEHALEGIFQTSPDGRLLTANPAMARIFGAPTPADLLAQATDIAQQLYADPQERAEVRRELTRSGVLTGRQVRGRRLDGRLIWASLNARAVLDATGRLLCYEGSVQDITASKSLEARLLHAERLQSVGRLASGIAHDLNNVLAPVLMAPPLLRPMLADPAGAGLLDAVEASARRGAAILRQLLAFSRGTDGARCRLQLEPIVAEMGVIMRATFPRELVLQLPPPPASCPIIGDATQIHQVLMNLCVNARDAMPQGGTLTLSLAPELVDAARASPHDGARPGPHIRLNVRDTGTGIPPEHLARLFEPFFTTKPTGRGTGLGLASVLAIARHHGGFVECESALGRGTEFRVFLPAAPAAETATSTPPPPSPSGHGELLLLVDDEASVRQLTRLILEQGGYTVIEAADGLDALTHLTARRAAVQLVLSDVHMPRLDAVGFVRELLARSLRVRVIAMTGESGTPKLAQLRGLGVTAQLIKPFDAPSLLRAVSEGLQAPPIAFPLPPLSGPDA